MLFAATGLGLVLGLSAPAPVRNGVPPSPAPRALHPAASADALFSRRARRMVQTYLRLKLLELREADLDRARAVIEHRLGIDQLLAP